MCQTKNIQVLHGIGDVGSRRVRCIGPQRKTIWEVSLESSQVIEKDVGIPIGINDRL